jgi:hypothetical protein
MVAIARVTGTGKRAAELILSLAQLVTAVGELRTAQRHTAQAAAARQAGEHLRRLAADCGHLRAPDHGRTRAHGPSQTHASEVIKKDFPPGLSLPLRNPSGPFGAQPDSTRRPAGAQTRPAPRATAATLTAPTQRAVQ